MAQIFSNQYQVRFNTNIGVNRYQLQHMDGTALEPESVAEVLKASRPQLLEKIKKFLTMGNIIYTPTKVDHIDFPENNLRLIFQDTLNPEQKEYQNLISRFFKQVIRQQREMVSVGNKAQKLFAPSRSVIHQDKKLEIWPGVECILTHHLENKLSTLTIDCAFKVLRDKTALQELTELRSNKQPLDKMCGEIVMTVYNRKFYKIERVNLTMTARSTFTNEKGETISFAEYYKKRYNMDIKAHDAPLLEASIREREKNSSSKEPVVRIIQLIPELCKMTGLTDEIRNNFHAMKAIATTTKPSGQTRVQEAGAFVKQLAAPVKGRDGQQRPNVFTEWGVQINPTPITFPDKSLPPGALLMGNNKAVDIRTANLDRETQQPMLKNGNMARWAVFYSQRDEGPCQTFLQEITKVNNDFKFGLLPPVVKTIQDSRANDQWLKAVTEVIQMAQGPQNVGFFLFILPGPKKKAPLYTPLKQLCINKYPVPTQVILFDTIKNGKGLRSICNKLCVQIVSKTGGVPWSISDIPPCFSRTPTMVIGYDIFHKKSDMKPSQLAFCSTIDPQFGRYYSQNIPSGEFSTHLEQLLKNAIGAFEASNKIKPQNIVIFRDGASDGQEQVIIDQEVGQFKNAIQSSGSASKLIFVITNKRVSAKFYTSSMENPAPGCIVDSKITKGNDFYLIAQKTTQGTVTPTHYKILYNDLANVQGIVTQIQSFAFKLCFLYYNWTGSIKIPSPVRYAHCFSNFIGDRYLANDPNQFLPNEELIKRNSLFYI